jgi:hypothetical protein
MHAGGVLARRVAISLPTAPDHHHALQTRSRGPGEELASWQGPHDQRFCDAEGILCCTFIITELTPPIFSQYILTPHLEPFVKTICFTQNKLAQQDNLTKQLRKRQKELKENSGALTNQKTNFLVRSFVNS